MARTKVFDEEVVLNKAVELFRCKGYNGTSAQDLVDCLGISRSSLYDTYGDKRSLFIQALQAYRKRGAEAMLEMINNSTDIAQTLEEIYRSVVTESLEERFSKGCFMVNSTVELALHDEEVAAIVTANRQEIEDALCKAIQKGQEDGQCSTKLPARALARFLFNGLSGIRVAAKSGVEKAIFDDIVNVTLSVLK